MPTLVKPSGWTISGVTPPPSGATPATFRSSAGIPYSTPGPYAVPTGLTEGDVLYISVEAPDANGRSLAGFTPIINNVQYATNPGWVTVLRGRIGATVPTEISLVNGVTNDSGVMAAYSGVGDLAEEVVTAVYNQQLTGAPSPVTIASGATVSQNGVTLLAATYGVGIGTDANGGGPSEPGITGWDLRGRHTTTYARFWAKQFDAGAVGNIEVRPYGATPNVYEELFIYFIEIPPTPAAAPTYTAPVQRGVEMRKTFSSAYPLAAPAGLAEGDVVYITINNTNDGSVRSFSDPNIVAVGGWSEVDGANTHYFRAFRGRIGATVPTGFTPTGGTTSDVAHIVAFSGVGDLADEVLGTQTTIEEMGGATSVPLPGITVVNDNSLVLAVVYAFGKQGMTFSDGLTNLAPAASFYTGLGVGPFNAGPTTDVDVIFTAPAYGGLMGRLISIPSAAS